MWVKAINNNLLYYNTRGFEFEVLKKIHSWTNTYIHGGYRPNPWKTETALFYLDKVFYSGKTSNSKSLSTYASVEVKRENLDKLRINTEESIKKDSEGKEVHIEWRNSLEIAII